MHHHSRLVLIVYESPVEMLPSLTKSVSRGSDYT